MTSTTDHENFVRMYAAVAALTERQQAEALASLRKAREALSSLTAERDHEHKLFIAASGELDRVWDALGDDAKDDEAWDAVARIKAERDELARQLAGMDDLLAFYRGHDGLNNNRQRAIIAEHEARHAARQPAAEKKES